MVCTALVVKQPLPDLRILSWGMAVNNADVGQCTRNDIIGKSVQFINSISSDMNAYVDLDLAYTGPAGLRTFHFPNVEVNSGTSNYIFTAGSEVYAEGTYNITNPGFSNIRKR